MYTDEERLAAVQMFIKEGYDAYAVKEKLGYPCELKLREWYKELMKDPPPKRCTLRYDSYSEAEKKQAIECFKEVGYSVSRTIAKLGYPSYDQLLIWVRNVPRRSCSASPYRLKYTYEERRKAVMMAYAGTGNTTKTAVAIEYGISRSLLHKWKHEVLVKEPDMVGLFKTVEKHEDVPVAPRHESGDEPMGNIKNPDTELVSETDLLRERVSMLQTNIDLMKEKIELQKQLNNLQEQVKQLQMEKDLLEKASELLKKAQGVSLKERSNREKAILIDALRNKYMVKELLQLLSISKSSYCYEQNAIRRADKYVDLRAIIKNIFNASKGTYGYRRIHASIKSSYGVVSEKVVRSIMAEEHLTVCTIKRKKYNSYMGEISPAVPNLINREFKADVPNKKWLTDITEFKISAGKVYLSPVIDCFDGMVVSWTIGTSPNADLVNSMLDDAISKLPPDAHPIVHSDRGCHYRWPGWIEKMDKAHLTRSMSKKGCSPDNAACEAFFGRLKNEFFYPYKWSQITIPKFIEKLDAYIHWYNEKRIKLSLGGMSPVDYRLLQEGV